MQEMIKFLCPHCQGKLSIDTDHAGLVCDCPKCGNRLSVPDQSSPHANEDPHPINQQNKTPHTNMDADGGGISVAQSIMMQVDELERNNHELQSRLDQVQTEFVAGEERRQDLEADLKRTRAERDALRKSEAEAVAEAARLLDQEKQLRNQLQEKSKAFEEIESALEEQKTTVTRLEQLASESRQQTKTSQSQVELAQQEIKLMREREDVHNRELKRLQQSMLKMIKEGDTPDAASLEFAPRNDADADELIRLRKENHELKKRLADDEVNQLRMSHRMNELDSSR